MRTTNKRTSQRKFYYLNQNIPANSLRVVDYESKQVGILDKAEALRQAQEAELDLVLIAPNAKPPVAKIIDFRKFLYQEKKKEQEAKKGIKKSSVKDISLSLFIADSDLQRFVEKGKEFLDEGNQLRLNLALKGREMGKVPMGYERIKKFIAELGEVTIAKEPRLEGRVIRAVIFRKK
ncbi:MAG: translation initiation factor IF-3 [Candidatus Roizmanbacteria bacterium]|nr:MAG: translation initiation factor IF-3 [Candidatus Roizmanbacteria bacterium]